MNPAPPQTAPPQAAPAGNAQTLRRLIGRFRPVWARAYGVFGVLLLRSGLEIAYPLLVATVVDSLVGHEGAGGALPENYVLLLWILGAVIAARAAGAYVSGVLAAKVSLDVENRLRTDLFRQVMRLRFTYHDKNRSGATIVLSLRDLEKARHFFREVWFGYLEIGLLIVAVVVASLVLHWSYGLLLAVVFTVGISGCVFTGRRIALMDRDVSEIYDGVTTTLQENVAGARVVRAFGREPHESQKFGKGMDRLSASWTRLERFWTGLMPIINNWFSIAIPAILALGTWRIAEGSGSFGEVTAVILYCRTVHYRLRPITRLVIVGQKATASAARVFEVLDEGNRIERPATPRRLPTRGGALAIEDVHFAYPEGPAVLQGVSLDVPAGTSLGLIGPTGAGKSTLAQLLPRFYDPASGCLRLDGIDVRDLDVHELRAAVGLVFQEAFLFTGSVYENIAYGNPDADAARVEACATQAAAHDFINQLPQGYDTVIGERGVSLSGGQCQRLTIARALAMDPRVLVFDDATASVDAVTEKQLFEGIRAAARDRTTLVISQRVTSVRWCDRIAVLDGGVVTAIGTHRELLEGSPLYKEIHSHQQLTGVLP